MNARATRGFGRFDYVKIAALGFALTALWSSLHSIVLPLRLLEFVDESRKNTYLGLLTFAGLILAMVVQPVAGAISDRSGFTWGHRRPYILVGAVLALVFLPGIGLAGSYAAIFAVFCVLQICTNIAQAPYQAFIPDLVPQDKRGLASGVKGMLEVLGGVAVARLAAYFMGRYFGGKEAVWLWMALGTLAVILLVATLVTVLGVREPPGTRTARWSVATLRRSYRLDTRAHRGFGWFLASRALLGMPGVILQVFAVYYLMDVVGIANPTAVAGDLLVIVGVCLLATVYPAGWLSDRIGRKPIIVFSGLLGAGSIVLLSLSRSYVPIVISGAILGVANGAMLSSTWAMATDMAVAGEEAKYLGLANLAMAGGSALARLVGPLIDLFNRVSAGLGYTVMLGVCFAGFAVGAIFILKVRQHHRVGP